MTCDAVLAILLEADLESVRAGDHAGADHLVRCPECRRAADRIVEGERVLDGWLSTATGPDTRAIVAAAEAEGEGERSDYRVDTGGSVGRRDPDAGPPSTGPAPRRRAVRAGGWIALAAAAVAAVLLVGDRGPRSDSDALDGPPAYAGTGGLDASSRVVLGGDDPTRRWATPEIEVPAGRNAAILRTDDPDITVIWFYGGD